jgi:hypothetical protein
MFLDQFANPVDFLAPEAPASLQPYGVKPELRLAIITFNMDVGRFTAITGVKEEPEWPCEEDSRHARMIRQPGAVNNTPHRALCGRTPTLTRGGRS